MFKMKFKEFKWDVGELPFIWTQFDNPEGDRDIPGRLPFKLELDLSTGVLKQFPDELTSSSLESAYEKGSVVAGVVDENIASKPYVDDFINFLYETTKSKTFQGLDILEIGCGTGYLLSLIKNLGGNVTGIEPGEHALAAKEKYGVELIRDFFPSPKINGKFDLIIMSIVLEHFVDPVSLLSTIHPFLKENGKLIISVPNEEPFLQAGDLSVLFHEHYSYFTDVTLENTLNQSGFKSIRRSNGEYSGLLLSEAISDPNVKIDSQLIEFGYNLAHNFKAKASQNIQYIELFISKILNENKTLGIYVPSRMLNFLSLLNIDYSKIRFFDDNASIYEKYFPGFPIKIENRSDLFAENTNVVLIFSKTFGDRIKSVLSEGLPSSVELVTWSDLFESFENK
jgi:SAM-dependent methyltransferase